MGLISILDAITEAKIDDVVARGNSLTYDQLINAILNSKDGKVTDRNRRAIADDLGVKSTTSLLGYIKKATDEGFLNKDGTVVAKYATKGGAAAPAPTAAATAKTPTAQPPAKASKTKEDEELEDDKEDDKDAGSRGVAAGGKISQALDSRMTKFIAPKVTNDNLFSQQVFKMLSLMDGQSSKSGIKNSLILTGDPGVGKTSFIRSYAKLLGIPLVTVEAPHITEEHIINIPFMIIKGDKMEKDSAVMELAGGSSLKDDGQSFEIVQAESNLVTKLKNMRNLMLKDQQHIASVARDKNLVKTWMNYSELIDTVRDSFNCILFLDEYYRNDNIKIRNILRNILNGRIGNDKIPKGTFIVYASNLSDDGLEDIPMNNDFAEMEFKAPDKEQWFDYMLKKYEQNENKEFPNIEMDHRVFNKFYKTLDKDDLSHDDNDAEVRTSPRRMEQLMLYVNANLPVNNVKAARILMSNVEVNFRNYIEGKVSNMYPKIQKMIVELIKETSGIEVDGSTHPQTEWKDVLEQQLATKIKMDGEVTDSNKEARKYVPIVSGEPGIGKTAHMGQVADNLDLHFIHIDVSTLTRESTTGIPKASQARDENGKPIKDKNGNPVMTTEFSKPELLDLIQKKMQEAIDEDSAHFPPEKRKKGQGRYKFLLLFDELTRADAQVFNSIRKLLLEKSFNEEYDLPAEIMVVGALNPEDEGVGELTKHTRDVVDIIPARASWSKTESYLLGEERPEGLEETMGFNCNGSTVGAVKNLLAHFQSKDVDWRGNPVQKEEKMFNMRDGGDVIYISPREITDIVTMINTNIKNRLIKVGIGTLKKGPIETDIGDMNTADIEALMAIQKQKNKNAGAATAKGVFDKNSSYSEEDFNAFIDVILVDFREVWVSKLSFVCKKQEIDPANFLSVTTGFIMKNNLVRDQYDAIKTKKVEGVFTMAEMFDAYFDNPEELYDSPHFDNYLAANFGSPQKFVQEITDFVADKLAVNLQGDNTGVVKAKNAKGVDIEIPKLASKNFTLYYKYLQYVKVILTVLTGKAEYAGQVREAERTGQYLSNLYASLKGVGNDFMKNQKLVTYLTPPDKMDGALVAKLQKLGSEIREMLDKFGLRPNK